MMNVYKLLSELLFNEGKMTKSVTIVFFSSLNHDTGIKNTSAVRFNQGICRSRTLCFEV